MVVAPVPSTLPVGRGDAPQVANRVGVFGYAAASAEQVHEVVSSLRALVVNSRPVELLLIGGSRTGRAVEGWRVEGAAAGVAVEATGIVSVDELVQNIDSCAVMVFASPEGPTSRKSTVAAVLGRSCAVVALDGSNTWAHMRTADSIALGPPRAEYIRRASHPWLIDCAARGSLT